MRLIFWRRGQARKTKKTRKQRARPKYETARLDRTQRRDDEVLLKLDAIMTFLRKHDMDVKYRVDQLAVARRILRENNLDEIIKERLSQGMSPGAVVKELISQGACSRATAYRYVSRHSKPLGVSTMSH